ncbi:Dabb family protein [Emticicia sp. BO119]|uniref:Dabb family protein n=1 Tax=Emticicia sp. BO119 TaxID=2757768 RepID=UPI0015F0FB5B|nr:Dabb family protein [Emticicia sp. BO119]MBA4849973.1 Dabb family protein [Emticicia sp. BO119]
MNGISRRNFVKNSALAAGTIGVVNIAEAKTFKELFVHHVYFYLKNPDSETDKAKLLEGLEKLSKVPTIRMVHIGVPATTTRSVIVRDYSVSWLCFFDNLDEEEIYQKHPIHLKFVEDYAHLWEKVNVYDSIGPKR